MVLIQPITRVLLIFQLNANLLAIELARFLLPTFIPHLKFAVLFVTNLNHGWLRSFNVRVSIVNERCLAKDSFCDA